MQRADSRLSRGEFRRSKEHGKGVITGGHGVTLRAVVFQIEVKFTNQQINHFKENRSVAHSTFAVLRSHQLCLVPERCHLPNTNPLPIKQLLPSVPSPQPLATTHLLSASIVLPTLNISFKWNYIKHVTFGGWLFVT